jgi:2-polyprenyl-3-methyl-5-hydroxy-6-metoxy-1,4-benzoquinol methylase
MQALHVTDQPPLLPEHPEVYRDDDRIVLADPCLVCGADSARKTYRIEGLASGVITCTRCGTGRLHPLPSRQEIGRYYPQQYYGDAQAKFEPMIEFLVRWVAARRVRSLTRGLRPGARVLDVGCGRGVLLSGLIAAGCETHGVEISRDAVAGADPRAQIRIASRLVDAKYPDGHFDLVVLWHVFEHLPDPVETLCEARRILRPGGRLVIAVPNYSSLQSRLFREHWFHLDLPRHIYHFPNSALQALLHREGFSCRSWHHFSLRQNPFGWLQSAINGRFLWPRNTLYKLLYNRKPARMRKLDVLRIRLLKLAGYACLPLGVLVSILTCWGRSGATVHVVAEVGHKPSAASGLQPDRPPAREQQSAETVSLGS